MKQLCNTKVVCCFLLVTLLSGCKKEIPSKFHQNESIENAKLLSESDKNKLAFYKETAVLLGEMFKDAKIKKSMVNFIKKEGGKFQTMSLYQIASDNTTNSPELSAIKNAFINKINEDPIKYKMVSNFFDDIQIYSTTKSNASVSSMDVEFYIPYNEYFTADDDITVTYDPIVRDDWNEGILYSSNSSEHISRIDEKYTQTNQTLMILPVDTTPESAYSKPVVSQNGELIGGAIVVPPTVNFRYVDRGLLKKNIERVDAIGVNDILYTTVPAIRVTSTAWCKFFGTALKLAVYRASGEISYATNGSIVPSASTHKPLYVKIPKRDIQNGKWINVGVLFDDNWSVVEHEQFLIFCSEHNEGNYAMTFSGEVKLGLKDNKVSFESGIKAGFTVNLGNHTITRLSNQLSRLSALTHVVGDYGAGTYNIGGTGFTIKRYGIVDMIFNYYHTEAIPY